MTDLQVLAALLGLLAGAICYGALVNQNYGRRRR